MDLNRREVEVIELSSDDEEMDSNGVNNGHI